MSFDFDPEKLYIKVICIIILITFSLIPLHIYTYSIKDNKDSICDSEKQSKFILECLNSKTIDTMGRISACEEMSIRLYCK